MAGISTFTVLPAALSGSPNTRAVSDERTEPNRKLTNKKLKHLQKCFANVLRQNICKNVTKHLQNVFRGGYM